MNEKERAYRAMKGAGTAGLTLGIIALAVGLAVACCLLSAEPDC